MNGVGFVACFFFFKPALRKSNSSSLHLSTLISTSHADMSVVSGEIVLKQSGLANSFPSLTGWNSVAVLKAWSLFLRDLLRSAGPFKCKSLLLKCSERKMDSTKLLGRGWGFSPFAVCSALPVAGRQITADSWVLLWIGWAPCYRATFLFES